VRIHVLAALLAAGCASSKVVIDLEETPGVFGSKAMTIGSVTVEPAFYGRGCLDIMVEDDRVTVALQQDGTSDWAGVRIAPLIARDVVAAALGFASAPWEIVQGLLGLRQEAPNDPSGVHGCEGLLED
jgi:hypothetical protein